MKIGVMRSNLAAPLHLGLGHSKANQLGQDLPENYKPLVGSAAEAMRDWLGALRAARITSGPIFRRVLAGDRMGTPLGAEGVRFIVKARCAAAGLDRRFSAHSLRSGFVTEAGLCDMQIGEAMAMTGRLPVGGDPSQQGGQHAGYAAAEGRIGRGSTGLRQ